MSADWFNEAVSNKPQTVDYLLQRMALTLQSPHHPEALKRSCHQQTANEIRTLHDEDRLASDHEIIFLGAKSGWVYHSILLQKDKVVFDSLEDVEWANFDAADEIYHTKQGQMIVIARVPVDDFFKNYVSKLAVGVSSQKPELVP